LVKIKLPIPDSDETRALQGQVRPPWRAPQLHPHFALLAMAGTLLLRAPTRQQ
jgi:hypothetical protein